MSAENHLAEIEAWGQELEDASSGPPEQFEAAENISDLIAALRAVLALHAPVSRGRVEDCCSTCCSDEECVSINDCGVHAEIEAAITTALTGEAERV